MVRKSMDGNEAAAYASYAFTEVATIYPITPSSPMANHVDEWAARGKKNLFGTPVKLMEMQAEAGACAAMQGALEAGSLGTTYTSAQGLMLMIPPMYRIAGLLVPAVMHVAARSVATEAVSIFGDHQDVMACRQTGWAQLASSSVQECMDLGAVAHLAAIKGHVPVQHFFDGFRTSHEIQKIDVLDYEDLRGMVDWDELKKFRDRALNPEHPTIRNSGENDDIFFQHREASNPTYLAFPEIVEDYMNRMSAQLLRRARRRARARRNGQRLPVRAGGRELPLRARRKGRPDPGPPVPPLLPQALYQRHPRKLQGPDRDRPHQGARRSR